MMNCTPMAKFGELFKWCFVHFPSQWTVRIESEHENAEPKIHHLILVDFLLFFGSPVECCVCSTVVCWEMNNRNCSNKFSDISFFFLWKCSRLWPSSIKTGRRAIGHLTPGVPPSTSRTGRCDYANYHDEYHLLIYKNITYFISSASVCENNEHVFFLRFFFLFYDFLHRFFFRGSCRNQIYSLPNLRSKFNDSSHEIIFFLRPFSFS